MPAPSNLSFEVLGPRDGQADQWTTKMRGNQFIAGFARNAFLGGGLSDPMALGSANWTASQVSVVSNTEDDPEGQVTAETLTDNGVNALHFLRRTSAIALENGKAYTFGFFARKSIFGVGISKIGAYFDLGGGNYAYSCFSIIDGGDGNRVDNLFITAGALPTITKINGSCRIFTAPTFAAEADNVWCLCATTILIAGTVSLTPAIILNPNTSGALTTYAGTGKIVDVWGAFFYEGALAAEESFDVAWNNDNYLLTMVLGVNTILFALPLAGQPFPANSKTHEDFEELWNNSPYLTAMTPVKATFDFGLETFEDWEEFWGAGNQHITLINFVDYVGDTITTLHEHGLINGDRVMLVADSVFPNGLLPNQQYFVINADLLNFQVSLTPGGAAVNFTDNGIGQLYVLETFPLPNQSCFISDPGDDLVYSISHGLTDGCLITFVTDDELPRPVKPNTQYLVEINDSDSFFLHDLSFGSPLVDIQDFESGTFYLERVTFVMGDSEPQEDFEEGWNLGLFVTRTFTAAAATDQLTITNHGTSIGTMVKVLSVQSVGNLLPSPLQPDQTYWVSDVIDVAHIKLAATPGGTAINLTSDSVGTCFLTRYFPSPLIYTANTGTDELQITAHPFLIGQRIQVDSTADLLPSPLVTFTNYYVVAKTANAFQISTTRNGSVINLTTTGTGQQFIARVFMNFYDPTPDVFGAAASDVENFETTRRTRAYTVDAGTDTFTSNAHGYSTNDVIFFTNDGGAVPGGINVTTPYFVIGATANTFQISLTQGGGAVNITDIGSGLQFFHGDPARYWIDFNDNI